jgi:hypothetical protein
MEVQMAKNRGIYQGCREEVFWHFITGRSWDGNGSVKSVEYGIGIWK